MAGDCCSWLSRQLSHLLVVFTHSTRWGFLCRAGSEGIAWRWRDGLYLEVLDYKAHAWLNAHCTVDRGIEHRCKFAPIETINKQDSKKKKKKIRTQELDTNDLSYTSCD